MAKVMREKADNKAKGYGFVSFLDPQDCLKAIREVVHHQYFYSEIDMRPRSIIYIYSYFLIDEREIFGLSTNNCEKIDLERERYQRSQKERK